MMTMPIIAFVRMRLLARVSVACLLVCVLVCHGTIHAQKLVIDPTDTSKKALLFPAVIVHCGGGFLSDGIGELRPNGRGSGQLGLLRIGVAFDHHWSAQVEAMRSVYRFTDSADYIVPGVLGQFSAVLRYRFHANLKGSSLYALAGVTLGLEERDMVARLHDPSTGQRGYARYIPPNNRTNWSLPVGVGGELLLYRNVFAFAEVRMHIGRTEGQHMVVAGMMVRF